MTWLDITRDWAKSYALLQSRFPNLEKSAMPFLKQDQNRFENYLAATHDLTLDEARDAFDAFLSEIKDSEQAALAVTGS